MHLAPDPSIRVTQDDLDFVRQPDPAAETPYLGVVRHYAGWRARAFKTQIGPVQLTPRAAAVAMVQWWKREYGMDWRAFWEMRQANGWKVVKGGVVRFPERCDVRVWLAVPEDPDAGGWLVRGKRGWMLSNARPASPRFENSYHARISFPTPVSSWLSPPMRGPTSHRSSSAGVTPKPTTTTG